MSLLNAQQSIAAELTKKAPEQNTKKPSTLSEAERPKSAILKKEQCPIALGGTALGGAAGAALIGTWGAVFGAIAGTAVALYFTAQQNQQISPKQDAKLSDETNSTDIKPIDTDIFVEIIENICQSVDTLIGTFRAQVHRVVDKYESIQKPTLESDYVDLLENIQSLLGAYSMDTNNESRAKRIEQRIQLLEESLDNYNLQSIVFDGNNKELFNFQPSANVTADTMVLPAITKEGKVIIKGKVFTKQ